MIHFKLKHINELQPAGSIDAPSLSWFWMTDGTLWWNISEFTLYEYTEQAQAYFSATGKMTQYNEYFIVRFLEDFTKLFGRIGEPVTDELYPLTENLNDFLRDAQKWLDLNDTDEEDYSNFYFEEFDGLISWIKDRSFDSLHLVGGPYISFFRNQDSMRISWDTDYELEEGIQLWTAPSGSVEIPYQDFIHMVKDFGKRFFDAMGQQVQLGVQKDWGNIYLDKKRLIEEHKERETAFWDQVALLETKPASMTDWESIRGLKSQMDYEIDTTSP